MPARSSSSKPGKLLGLPVFAVVLIGVALLVGIGIALASLSGGDDDDTASGDDGASVVDEGSAGVDDPIAFGPVSIDGDPLPTFDGSSPDPAVGMAAPTIDGFDLYARPTALEPTGQPTLVVFLAHWCPHCQRELPLLVGAEADGVFEDIRMVAVITGTNEQAPNFPPADWMQEEGWEGDVIVDNDRFQAGEAFGLAGYPFMVWLDAEGTVVARTSGELTIDQLDALAQLITTT